MLKHIIISIVLLVCFMLLFSINAAAYLDPSAMTYIIQAVAGVIIAGGAAILIYWKKLKVFFNKKRKNKKK